MHQLDPPSSVAQDTVDLTNCDKEPIHILGRVQSFGALISVSSDWIVNQASTNIETFIGESAGDLIGRSLVDCLSEEAVHDIRSRIQLLGSVDAVERLFGVALMDDGPLFDLAVHLSGRSIIIELERHSNEKRNDYVSYVRPMIDRVGKAETVETLCDAAAKQLRALTRFDRVMVYKFNADDTGTVISEALKPGLEPYKGLRYPASDIPKQARALYKRNLLRIISDVSDTGHEIIPGTSPEGAPLDLSLSAIRAVSPIHLEYLKNMGVHASMSISILKRGKLWGLFACHNETPKTLSYDVRTAAELFGQLFAFVLDQRESDAEREDASRARILHDQLMAQLAEGSSIGESFDMIAPAIENVIPFDGIVGWVDDRFVANGQTPTEEEFRGLVRFLNTTAASQVYANDHLAKVFPKGEDFANRAAGLLALPVSRSPRDYIVLFRREVAKSVQWAGNPNKPVESGPNGMRLTPRKSFEAWQELVRNQCTPWTKTEFAAAEALRITLLEVVLRMSDASNRERAKAQERQELLIAELNHRVRNILNLIRSLITQSKSESNSASEFTEIIGGRIHALARAHDQITQENWSPTSLYDLIQTEAEAYLGGKAERVIISGPDPLVEPVAFTALSLVIHELMTNSAKYGALCDSTGSIQIKLETLANDALGIHWREIGGPPISKQPSGRGFGTTIIERSIPHELQGTSEIRFETTGVQADFMIPAAHISGYTSASAPVKEIKPKRSKGVALSGNVLLVEDNMIIAMDAEDFLHELGAKTVHVSANVADALEILDQADLNFALLDVNLGNETSEPIAQALQAKSIPFVFATGYGDTSALTKSFPNVSVVRKPFDKASIEAALGEESR